MITERFTLGGVTVSTNVTTTLPGGGVVNALANPSAFGWPDETNTGAPAFAYTEVSGNIEVRDAGLYLQNGTLLVTRPGVWGPFTLTTNHTTLLRGLLTGRILNKSAKPLTIDSSKLIAWDNNVTGYILDTKSGTGWTTIVDSTLDAKSYRANTFGPRITMTRCNIRGGEDSIDMGWDVNLYDCYVHDMVRLEGSHNDIIQSGSTGRSGAHHCTLIAAKGTDPMNAVVMIGDYGGQFNGFTVEDSLCDGGNYTMNDNWRGDHPVSNLFIRNNRFGRRFRYGVKSLNAVPGGSNPWSWTGNVWDDTNQVIP